MTGMGFEFCPKFAIIINNLARRFSLELNK